MLASTPVPNIKDTEFKNAQASFQKGDWENGLSLLDVLVERYPEIPELREFQQEMLLRSRIDEYERAERRQYIKRRVLYWGSRVGVIVIILGLFAWGLNTYSSWLQDQWDNVRQSVMQEVQTLDTAVKFRNAQNFLGAGRPEDAFALLNEIEEQDPEFPGLAELQAEASKNAEIEQKYKNANSLLESGDTAAAIAVFREIQNQQPDYKDVPILINEIEGEIILNDLITQAENAFDSQDWDNAILRYDSLRTEAPNYEPELVEERLIDSYINAATMVLGKDEPTSDALILADQYFRDALELSPLDPEILSARDQALDTFKEKLFASYLEKAHETLFDNEDSLASLKVANSYYDLAFDLKPGDPDVARERLLTTSYLKAQQSFLEDDWDTVINNLETVFQRDKDFANGTTRQTLYEAYMKRGRKLMTNGEYESAIEDYQRAAEIADESSETKIQVYWSLIEMADIYGILGEYQKADSIYSHAVEWIGLRDILQTDHPDMVVLLDEADRYAGIEYFRTAYRLYNRVLPAEELIYSTEFYDVAEGDYLTNIARKYKTTVQAILSANDLTNPGEIKTGQRILVPILSKGEN
jgi:tetratricopeptide (TPR) repeat protein